VKLGRENLKKVLLINEGFSNNLGDRAINLSIKRVLELNECNVECVDFVGCDVEEIDISETIKEANAKVKLLRKITPMFIRTIRAQIKWLRKELNLVKRYCVNEYDFIIIGGGQLILSNFYFPMAMYIWVNKFARKKNVKIYIIGVGAGDVYTFIDKYLYKRSLAKVNKLFVRDNKSIEILEDLLSVKAEFIPDMAFYLEYVYPKYKKSTNKALVGIVDYQVYKLYNKEYKSEIHYIEEWIEEIKKICDEGYEVELFYTTPEDYLQSIKLKKQYEEKYNHSFKINKCNNLKELASVIQSAEKLISARMHGLIIAMNYGVKITPYEISNKIKTFNNEYIKTDVSIKELQEEIYSIVNKLVQ
jgi:polysaccharide pyruvyl transferase WcaK-like protein